MRQLEGRTAVITGASQGLGQAIAAAYVREGASVLLCARDIAALEATAEGLQAFAGNEQRVLVQRCDVAVRADVDALARRAETEFPALHILVNNAGVYGPMGAIEDVDWDEWVQAVTINLLGSVAVARAFVPGFRARGYGKVVQLSGGGATAPLPRISAYAASKAAIVRFTETLAEELRGSGVDANSIAPGALNTRLLDQVLEAGPERVGQSFYDRSIAQQEQGGAGLERGAELAVYLGSAASDGLSGKLLSAVWDPWPFDVGQLASLSANDVYTLRRIVPEDRQT